MLKFSLPTSLSLGTARFRFIYVTPGGSVLRTSTMVSVDVINACSYSLPMLLNPLSFITK